jgi:hypothetical protein
VANRLVTGLIELINVMGRDRVLTGLLSDYFDVAEMICAPTFETPSSRGCTTFGS